MSIDASLRGFTGYMEHLEDKPGVRISPSLVKVEGEMKRHYLKGHPEEKDRRSFWLRKILVLPYEELYDLWETAFEDILSTLPEHEKDGRDVFLNLHATYYHHYTTEYISVFQMEKIRNFSPSMIITLIDDIHDIHDRLKRDGEIFDSTLGGSTNREGAIIELLRILDWRAREIMMSRFIAREMEIPHFVFAVKHPYDTLYSLLYDESKPKMYFSHPISEVRRLQRDGKEEKAVEVISTVRSLSSRLSEECVVFYPTTIDELRIKNMGDPNNLDYYPVLLKRWEADQYASKGNSLFEIPVRDTSREFLWTVEGDPKDVPDKLLKALNENIDVQVSSRDHKLVEQSECIFAYRPCFNGNISGGMLKEIQYYNVLKRKALGKAKKCFVYLPRTDQMELRRVVIGQVMRRAAKEGPGRLLKFRDEIPIDISVTNSDCVELIDCGNDIETVAEIVRKIMRRLGISVAGSRHGLDSDWTQGSMDVEEKIAQDYVAIIREDLDEYYKAATHLWEEDNLSVQDLSGRIMSAIAAH